MDDQLNDEYAKEFKETYQLVDNETEVGAKRFSVVPLWKPVELMPEYDAEACTKKTLRRFLALQRKINIPKNKKRRTGIISLSKRI